MPTIAEIAQSYDFFNPFMSARIVAKDGTTYPLWTTGVDGKDIFLQTSPSIEHKDGEPLKALAFMTEIQVEMLPAAIPRMSVKLEPPYIDAIKFLDSELIEFGTHRLKFNSDMQRGLVRTAVSAPSFLNEWKGLCYSRRFRSEWAQKLH